KRQRLEDLERSNTVETLTSLVGRGQLHISAAAEIAQNIVKDTEFPPAALRAFASLGAAGDHPQNCERDLHRWLHNLFGVRLEPYKIHLDLQVDGAKATKTPVYVLLPHEIIHCLATSHCPFLFNSALLGNLDGVARAQFWSHVYSLDPWKRHPVLNRDDVQFDKLIGVTIHGDGAAMKREDEAF
ncbi:unnamed protein product, partial [Durusdinium trenchii]